MQRILSLRRVGTAAAFLLLVATLTVPAGAVLEEFVWTGNGSNGNWDNQSSFFPFSFANWTRNGSNLVTQLPDGDDTVLLGIFPSGTPTLNGLRTIGRLDISALQAGHIIAPTSDTLRIRGVGGVAVTRAPGSSGTHTIGSNVQIVLPAFWDIEGGSGLVLTGKVSGEALVKVGSGRLVLQGTTNNTTGSINTVFDGTLRLSMSNGVNAVGGAIQVGSGGGGGQRSAILEQRAHNNIPDSVGVNLHDDGWWTMSDGSTDYTETIQSLSASHLVGFGRLSVVTLGHLTVGSGATVIASFAGRLENSGTGLGGGTFTKIGTSSQTLRGSFDNTHTGLTKVSNGTLFLSKDVGVDAMGGNVQVGNGIGSSGTAVLTQTTNHNIPDTSDVDVKSDGRWNVLTETVDAISGSGIIVLSDLTVGAHNGSGTFSGTTFDSNGTNGKLTKIGTGSLTLSGPFVNTHTGLTKVSNGTLILSKVSTQFAMLGNIQVGDGNVPNGTAVLTQTTNENIPDTSNVFVDGDGRWNVSTETVNAISGSGVINLGNLTVKSGMFSGRLQGTGKLTKTTTGLLTLSGNNTHTGGTTVSGGTLVVNTNSLPTANGVTNNAILEFNQTANGTYSGVISGTGRLDKSGAGKLTLTASNSFTGAVNVNAGTLEIGGAGEALNNNAVVTVANGATLRIAGDGEGFGSLAGAGNAVLVNHMIVGINNASTTFSGSLSGGSIFVKRGSGTMKLTGNNNAFTGDVFVNGGILEVGLNDGLVQPAAYTVAGAGTLRVVAFEGFGSLAGEGNTQLNANLQVGFNGDTTVYSGQISGVGIFDKRGAGTMTLSGTNTHTGGTRISVGSLEISENANLGANSSPVTFAGGTLRVDNSIFVEFSAFRGFVTSGADAVFDAQGSPRFDIRGGISGNGGLVKNGPGVMNLLTTVSTYTGPTTINQGQLGIFGSNELLPDSTDVTINGGNLGLLGNVTETIDSLSGVGNVRFLFNPGNHLIVGAANGSGSYAGNIVPGAGGDGRLTKIGTGTQTLSGNSTYTGGTTVSGGRLVVDTDSLPASNGVANNATLEFNQASDDTYGGVISGTGGVTKKGNGVLTLDQANTYTGGTTVSGGKLVVDTDSLPTSNGVVNNATLEFNQGGDGTYSGVISGSGGVTKTGNGALTLDQANTYTSGTTVSAGTLVVDTDSLPVSNGVVNNAILEFDQGGDDTYGGVISGSGGVTKKGLGVLTLDQASTYTGGTIIDDGALVVVNTTGSATGSGPVAVKSGTTLGGDGSIDGQVTLEDGATLTPGTSVGVLGLGGVTFEENSTFVVELATNGGVAGTDFDQVAVTSNVSFDGTLNIVRPGGLIPNYFDEFEILTAATRSGAFDQVNGAVIDLDMFLVPVYDHNGNTGLTLVAVLPGDANLDGTVNGDDLLRWQANLFSGDEFVQGDFNLDGTVNGDDLLIWQANLFNTVPTPAPATAPIPEPGTAVLLLGLGVLGMATRRRVA